MAKTPAKKTVRRKSPTGGRPAPGTVAEFPTVDAAATETPALPPLPEPENGQVNLTPPSDRKIARLLMKLQAAEDEAASWAAIADDLLDKNRTLAKQNRELTEHVRAMETAMFEKDEGESGEEEESAAPGK